MCSKHPLVITIIEWMTAQLVYLCIFIDCTLVDGCKRAPWTVVDLITVEVYDWDTMKHQQL